MMIFSKRSQEGYLLIDHSAVCAPPSQCFGVPAGTRYESATVQCCHCNITVVLNPKRTRPRGHCQKCDAYVCDSPQCSRECKPFKKIIDEAQERASREIIRG